MPDMMKMTEEKAQENKLENFKINNIIVYMYQVDFDNRETNFIVETDPAKYYCIFDFKGNFVKFEKM